MTDLNAIRWESLVVIAGVLALAVWALRDPAVSTPAGISSESAGRFRAYPRGRPARIADLESGAMMGRSADCSLRLDDATVSKHHARFALEDGPRLYDLSSTNGTYVNGRHIDGSERLRKGDRIALGAAKIVFLGLAPRGQSRPKG